MPRYSIRREKRRRLIRRTVILFLFAVIVNAYAGLWQERPRTDLIPADDGLYRYAGAIHIHSVYSDGSGTVEDIVRAAHDTGLDFIILTDHSTIQPLLDNRQGYHNGVLTLVGEEVNTSAGHLLALGVGRHVEQKGPQGLQALIDTINTAGGLAILAHPDGRRPWTDWSIDHIQGLELLNADSAWRHDNPWEWLRALIGYPFLPEAAMSSLIYRPDAVLQRWQPLSQRGHVIGIGSVDAHARIPLWGNRALRFPPYERMFRLVRTYVMTDHPLAGDAGTDGAMILDALRNGRCYVAVDGYERAVQFSFELVNGEEITKMGGRAVYRPGSRFRVKAGSSGPVLIRLFRDGIPVADMPASDMIYPITAPGVYRAEVYQLRSQPPLWKESPRPWIFSNPIWVIED